MNFMKFKKAASMAVAVFLLGATTLVGAAPAFAAGPNLIANPSLETAAGALPASWQKGGFGNNTAVFTYPVAGIDGANAAKIAMTARTGGDAKWFFNDVTITPGKSYTFSDQYKSTVTTKLVARYTSTSNVLSYVDLGSVASSANAWKTFSYTFTAPAGSAKMTVFHLIAAVGELTTDAYSLTENTVGSDTTAPTIALTAPAANASVSNTVTLSATATDNVGVVGVQFIVDGANVGAEDTTSPYSIAWDSKTVANGTHTISAKARDAAGNTTTTTPTNITVSNTVTPPADTTPPTVTLTAPAPNATLSGSATLTATATDNVAVTGVQFIVDGANFGSEIASGPYTAVLDTTTLTNGSHTIAVAAHDAANNSKTTTAITVTVSNTVTPPATNLIANHSLEMATGSLPTNWSKGNWGTNNATFTYPATGIDGAKAAKVAMITYTDGDAKWFFDDVVITPGKNYVFSSQYKSTVPTTVLARYTNADASVTYVEYAHLLSSNNQWTAFSHEFTAPAGVTKVTVFHLLAGVGELTIDNYALGDQSNNTSAFFSQGIVSFTFDDGWISHYDTVRPILNAAGLKGSFYIITDPMNEVVEPNKVLNSGLETNGGTGAPTNWQKSSWGTNNATFTYPTAGKSGNGAKVAITNYTDGDAKWFFDDVAIVANTQYRFRDSYKSTTPTTLTARFTMADNTVAYRDLAVLPSSGNSWTTTDIPFTSPANVQSVTVFHHLASVGELTIDDASLTLYAIYANPTQVQELQAQGHEVGGHTKTHPDLTTLTTQQATDEIVGSRTALQNIGITVNTMVYPYGASNASIQQITKNAGYLAARTVEAGYNTKVTDHYALRVQNIGVATTLADVQGWVTTAAADHTWLILVFHQVDLSGDTYGTTPALFQQMVDYVKTQPVQVRTMDDVRTELNP